jgi:trimethylamine:corrinoid methyltransferase-like protein
MLVRNERARQIFAEHGAKVDSQTNVVKIPHRLVEQYRKVYPLPSPSTPVTRSTIARSRTTAR